MIGKLDRYVTNLDILKCEFVNLIELYCMSINVLFNALNIVNYIVLFLVAWSNLRQGISATFDPLLVEKH